MILMIISIVYKWRYRILNAMMSNGIIRKIIVRLSVNMPGVLEKLVPDLFHHPSSKEK